MATENAVLMRQAREALSGNWGLAIGTCFVYAIIVGLQLPLRFYTGENYSVSTSILNLILAGPLALGLVTFSLAIARKQHAEFSQLFSGFNRFADAFIAYLMVAIYTLLWMLLLIIPGIIAAISYAQTFFIMADDKTIRPSEAIDKSKKMMDGYKMKFFTMCLRFFGLSILCILTLGIGFLWLIPYMYVTMAKFYDDIKDQPAESTVLPQ